MTRALIYITQPTDAPIWHVPSLDPKQPHIVQLASMVVDVEKREEIERNFWMVRPSYWKIPQQVLDDIGITEDEAIPMSNASSSVFVGFYEGLALNEFFIMWKKCDFRVSYGEPYHSRIIRIALKRYMADGVVDDWKAQKDMAICAMRESTNVLKLPQTVGRGKYKFPKLGEANEHFTGKSLPEKTSIDERISAVRDIYFGLLEVGA